MTVAVALAEAFRATDPLMLVVVAALSCAFVLFGLDDLLVDLIALSRRIAPRALAPAEVAALRAEPEERIAIIVPAWREAAVIQRMLRGNIARLDYRRYDFFVGVYPNDADTLREVEAVAACHPNVHAVVGSAPGPTSKGQILNCVVRQVQVHSRERSVRYVGLLMQDAEDVMHPLSLRLLRRELQNAAFVQMPVFSLQVRHARLVAGTYMDEFAESHTKDMLVRAALGAPLPSAGVATGLSWALVKRLLRHDGKVFNEGSLTEDYEVGIRAGLAGFAARFVCVYLRDAAGHREYVATRELFPASFRRSVRQKARWTLGIALQGTRNLGWSKSVRVSYWLYRDRKGLVTNPLACAGYLCGVWLAGAAAAGAPLTTGGGPAAEALPWLLAANTAFMTNRYLQRCVCTARVYGWRSVPLVLARWPVAILINALACLRALRTDGITRWRGVAARWEKTEHELPSGFGETVVTQASVHLTTVDVH